MISKKFSHYSILILLALFPVFSLTGQEIPQIIPPSPEAAAFGKYGDIPISTYTGIPNISISYYQIKDFSKEGNAMLYLIERMSFKG